MINSTTFPKHKADNVRTERRENAPQVERMFLEDRVLDFLVPLSSVENRFEEKDNDFVVIEVNFTSDEESNEAEASDEWYRSQIIGKWWRKKERNLLPRPFLSASNLV